jgi:large subunit ribosomal protein L21
MGNYFIVRTGGKQYKVEEGSQIDIERIPNKVGESYSFKEVLLKKTDNEVLIGTPLINNLMVDTKIIEQKRGKKIRVATYKAKSRYRKVKGHRQYLTTVEVLKTSNVTDLKKIKSTRTRKTKKAKK